MKQRGVELLLFSVLLLFVVSDRNRKAGSPRLAHTHQHTQVYEGRGRHLYDVTSDLDIRIQNNRQETVGQFVDGGGTRKT